MPDLENIEFNKETEDGSVFRQLFDLMPQLGWTAKPDGFIDYYNKGWYDYTGRSFEDMQGWGWKSVHHPDHLDRVIEEWSRSIETGIACELEFPLRRHDGEFRWFLTRINPLFNEKGMLVRWVGINTDIQDQKEKETEEKRRSEALAELDRAKTVFFNNISHEFRTPLTLMLGPLESLKGSFADAAQKEEIEAISRNSARLLKLVNTLLDFSKIEAGRYDASFEPTDLATFTKDIASTFRSTIENAGLEFEVHCQPSKEKAFIDRDMWEKIVLNLLSNAFKFTRDGSIKVTLEEENNEFVLKVSDTGIGVGPDDIENLFERFHTVKGEYSRTEEGTGIGLALVTELVKLHDGSITVDSQKNKGSTFTVTIPKGKAHLPDDNLVSSVQMLEKNTDKALLREAQSWSKSTDLSALPMGFSSEAGPKVVVVDDNADMRAYLRRLLSPFMNVDCVSNGEEALACIREKKPDLVLADIMMPVMNGIELVRKLRENNSTRSLSVMLLSARAGEEARAEGLEAGADDYLVKPFASRELFARMTKLLNRSTFVQELERTVRERTRELEETRDQAISAQQMAEDALETRTRFLATISHEVRTPLGGIIGLVEILVMTAPDDDTKNLASTALDSCKQLLRILNDLLDSSKLEAGKLTLEFGKFSLKEIVRDVEQLLKPDADKKKLALTCNVGSDIPEQLCGDGLRVRQILLNLALNAVKFTEQGEVKIDVCLDEKTTQSEGVKTVSLHIQDTGIGIRKEQLPQLFQPFSQVHDTGNRAYGGTGLGLSISNSLAEMMGGTITVESEPGRGSIFTVTIPFDEARCQKD